MLPPANLLQHVDFKKKDQILLCAMIGTDESDKEFIRRTPIHPNTDLFHAVTRLLQYYNTVPETFSRVPL